MGESILIKGNRIACVGSNTLVRNSMSPDCEVIDLRQSIVFPGFVDAHCHVKGLGQSQEILRLDNTTSFNDVVAMVQNQAKFQDIDSWILGRNWNQKNGMFPICQSRLHWIHPSKTILSGLQESMLTLAWPTLRQ